MTRVVEFQTAKVPRERIMRDATFSARSGNHDRAHVRTLVTDLRNRGPFKPVLLWRDPDHPDERLVLLDGGYRLDAYRSAGWAKGIPAKIAYCDRHAATLLAASANTKDAKPLTTSEKADLAWRLVRTMRPDGMSPEFSISETARAAGVVTRTVSNMRKRWAQMRTDGTEPTGVWRRDCRDHSADWQGDLAGLSDGAQRKAVKDRARALREAMEGPGARENEFVGDVLVEAYGHRLQAIFDYLYGDADPWSSTLVERDYDDAPSDDDEAVGF